MLEEQALGNFIDARYRDKGNTLFRMEALPLYSVESDGADWERWQAGATEPTWERKQPWLDVLRADREKAYASPGIGCSRRS